MYVLCTRYDLHLLLPPLIKLIVGAHQLKDALVHSGGPSIEEIAREKGFTPSYAARLIRLAFLSPDLTTTILAGKQPPDLAARKLMADTRLPLAWPEQRSALGLARSLSPMPSGA